MKNQLKALLAILTICILFASCKKDRICTCTDGEEFQLINVTPSQAKKECKEAEDYQKSVSSSSVTCKIM